MKRFLISATLVCPSSWTRQDAEAFVQRNLLSTDTERLSLRVLEEPEEPALIAGAE